ncbi:hypothetical protein L1887_08907 [Cichorium endivia]|nr:hypothetical protein L1887_08907 [Cichorium endivia]
MFAALSHYLRCLADPLSPRFDHTATVHVDRYLQIFGGCSHSIFFNDLHVLDLETNGSNRRSIIQGDLVSPRAGYAGVSIDENWYIFGGGDNKNWCLGDIGDGYVKTCYFNINTRKRKRTTCQRAASATAAYALAKFESLEFTTMDLKHKLDLSVEVNMIKGEKKTLESSITVAKAENSVLKEKLEGCNGAHVDLSKELDSVKGQMASERSKCADLEVF